MTDEELLATVEESGDCEFNGANGSNIPVGIFLREIEEEDEDYPSDHKWLLSADNFMPRKGLSDSAYQASAPTREALVLMVQKYIKPLYEVAIENIDGIISGTNDSLYCWCPAVRPGQSQRPETRQAAVAGRPRWSLPS